MEKLVKVPFNVDIYDSPYKDEIWVEIKGFPNYKVSNLGRVISLNYKREGIAKILKQQKNSNGYSQVCLSKNGKSISKRVHRIVAEAFIPNPNNFPQINHKDEDKNNNCVENLEWCDQKYNSNYGTAIKRCSDKRKNNENRSKKVAMIKDGKTIKIFPSLKECGRNGFNTQIISQLCNKNKKCRYKSHKGFEWEFLNEHLLGTTDEPKH